MSWMDRSGWNYEWREGRLEGAERRTSRKMLLNGVPVMFHNYPVAFLGSGCVFSFVHPSTHIGLVWFGLDWCGWVGSGVECESRE